MLRFFENKQINEISAILERAKAQSNPFFIVVWKN